MGVELSSGVGLSAIETLSLTGALPTGASALYSSVSLFAAGTGFKGIAEGTFSGGKELGGKFLPELRASKSLSISVKEPREASLRRSISRETLG